MAYAKENLGSNPGTSFASFSVQTIDVHAEGELGRVVPNAERFVLGDTMGERFDYCARHLNWLREFLLSEPRGYPAACGVFLLPPVVAGSDIGIIVLEQTNFTPMSGSNTMSAVTAAIESGALPAVEPVTKVVIDTAIGTITAWAEVKGGKVRSVTVRNVPSYAVAINQPLLVAGFGEVKVDIAFGGQFFGQLDIRQLGITPAAAETKRIARAGAAIKAAMLQQIQVQHPTNPAINAVNLITLHNGPLAPGKRARNATVQVTSGFDPTRPETWDGALDRSPCGTGTSARLAALFSRGELAVGDEFVHQSIIGSEFIGRIVGETVFEGLPAISTTITGRAWITGRSTWELDPSDPYPRGFSVGDI